MYPISFVKVASVVRAGIHPSQYSTARRQPAGAAAVPDWNRLHRSRFERHVGEIEIVILETNSFTGPKLATDLHIASNQFSTLFETGRISCRGELMRKSAQTHSHDDASLRNGAQAREQLREMDRMTMADRHRRAKPNVFRHGSDRRKH